MRKRIIGAKMPDDLPHHVNEDCNWSGEEFSIRVLLWSAPSACPFVHLPAPILLQYLPSSYNHLSVSQLPMVMHGLQNNHTHTPTFRWPRFMLRSYFHGGKFSVSAYMYSPIRTLFAFGVKWRGYLLPAMLSLKFCIQNLYMNTTIITNDSNPCGTEVYLEWDSI